MSSGQEGIQTESHAASTASFETALVFNAAVFGAELVAFTLLFKYFKTIYEPRTFLVPQRKRVQPLPEKFFEWPVAVFDVDMEQIRIQNGLDAYMFVRFLRMMVMIFFPIWIISWAVLLPVTSVGTSVPGRTGLDRFTFGNVAPNASSRYSAHLVLAWLFTVYILYVVTIELRQFITLRQRHLVDPAHSASAQANTVLVTGVPQKYLNETALTHLFGHVPGGVKKVWLNRDLKGLPDIFDHRLAVCDKLESAENVLLKTAAKLHRKKTGVASVKVSDVKEKETKGALSSAEADMERRGNDLQNAELLVPRSKRPTHRLPIGFLPFSLPFIGKKVDTIEWARTEILKTNKILAEERRVLETEIQDTKERERAKKHARKSLRYPALNSAFVLFNEQIGAHMAVQSLTHHEPFCMASKYTEVAPDDVIWGNLGLNPYEANIRTSISYALTAGLILAWAIPVAFVGFVSNVAGLCATYKWLAWLCKLPKPVVGIIQGILPPVLLAVLFMLLPIILRLLARFEGIPTRTGIERSLMTRFFIFQVVHGFLIVTLSSGIIAALPSILQNPGAIPTMLAQKLPNASTFFLTFIILQGLSGTAGGFLTIIPLALYYVKLSILGSTPRSIYNIKYVLRDVEWGTLFPGITLLVVIAFGYSIISPIINGLACATFFLFYMLYKYLFIWQLDMPPAGDSGGLFFPEAIQQVLVGLYVQQICLCALFFLAQDENKKQSAIPEGALMVVLIALTLLYHQILNSSLQPLLEALPLSLADKSYGMPKVNTGVVEDNEGDEEEEADQGDDVTPARQSEGDDEIERAEISEALSSQSEHGITTKEPTVLDFAHPAVREDQRVIWLAADALGLAHAEVRTMVAEGVRASAARAVMDGMGNVDVEGRPPGMD